MTFSVIWWDVDGEWWIVHCAQPFWSIFLANKYGMYLILYIRQISDQLSFGD